jgi:hypothetical protein
MVMATRVKIGSLQRFIVLYMATKSTRCASLDELEEAIIEAEISRAMTQNIRINIVKALSKLYRNKWIKKGWILAEGRRKRIYCLENPMTKSPLPKNLWVERSVA